MARTNLLSAIESPELKKSIGEAEAGRPAKLEFFLCRASGLPGPRPNFDLAQAVALDFVTRPASATRVLLEFAKNEAAPVTPEVFLPMVSAFGFVLFNERGIGKATDDALAELAADDRLPVRRAVEEALSASAARRTAPSDWLIDLMEVYLANERRDVRWGAFGVVLDALMDHRALERLGDRTRLLDVLSRFAADLGDAPRAAERSDARRRGLSALGRTIPKVLSSFRGTADASAWLEAECERARQPEVRHAFEEGLALIRKRGSKQGLASLERLGAAIARSQKPPRDPTLKRVGTRRRGK